MAPSARQAVTAGAVLAETYEVTRLLGEGGMGAVWEARHLRLERKKVAIKVLHGFVVSDGEAVGRFQREANIASRLGHPNIIQVHDFNTLPGGAPYLVLEYLEGESLNERLRRGPLPLTQALTFARQIGSALQAAHNEGIVHRDLKPHNVFLCPSETHGYATEQIKVLDFGISKIQGSDTVKTQTNAILGTPQYMSPEQAKGAHRDIDHRTDVFALGAIVYEMLTGRPAFLGDSIPEVMFKVVYEEPPPLAELVPGLPPRVLAAVEHALLKNRDQRCESAAAFVEELTGDPLITLRGGPATANVHNPMLSASLAAAAASRNQIGSAPGVRTGSPEAFAATMATGGGHQPADAFGATMASVNSSGNPMGGPGAHAAMAATAAQPHVHAPGAGHASPHPGHPGQPPHSHLPSPAMHGQLPAHPYDTAPVVDRPRHVSSGRGLRFLVAGGAMLASIAVVFVLVRSFRDDGSTTGTSVPTQPAAATDQPAAADPPPTAHATSATNPAQTGDTNGTTAPATNGATGDKPASGTGETTTRTDPKRDPGDRPNKTEKDMPEELKKDLAELEAQLKSDPKKAISLGKKLRGKYPESSDVARLLTRAFCAQDAGTTYLNEARGSFSAIKSGRAKREVAEYCKGKGLLLEDRRSKD